MKKILLSIILGLSLLGGSYSCKVQQSDLKSDNANIQYVHPTLYSTLYQQNAAEYKALCFQAFNLASLQLQRELKASRIKPLAVVVDIDETVLDNIPYQAAAILGNFGYPVRWKEWMESASAEAIPGSLEFLTEAQKYGAEVFYVSNRKEEFRQATIRNLHEKGFPNADNEHLLLRTTATEKESRRQKIIEKYEIAVLIGDNLGDFNEVFETSDSEQRLQKTVENKSVFGYRWIVLPNAVYGGWVDVLPGYNPALNPGTLSDSLKSGLKGF